MPAVHGIHGKSDNLGGSVRHVNRGGLHGGACFTSGCCPFPSTQASYSFNLLMTNKSIYTYMTQVLQ